MSRIDDNSDEQRIREMQEQELRNRTDRDKKAADVRVTKSFNEVMKEKSQTSNAQKALVKDKAKQEGDTKSRETEQQRNAAQQLLRRGGKTGSELQKRAALSQAMSSGLASKRSQDSQKVRDAEVERTDDMLKKADD